MRGTFRSYANETVPKGAILTSIMLPDSLAHLFSAIKQSQSRSQAGSGKNLPHRSDRGLLQRSAPFLPRPSGIPSNSWGTVLRGFRPGVWAGSDPDRNLPDVSTPFPGEASKAFGFPRRPSPGIFGRVGGVAPGTPVHRPRLTIGSRCLRGRTDPFA